MRTILFRNIDIEDYPVPVETELDAKLRRSLRFKSKSRVINVWMKVAEGESIEQRGEGQFVVDGRLQLSIRLSENSRPLVRSAAGLTELLVPVDFANGEAFVDMELVW